MKSRSREIGCYNDRVAVKCDGCLGSTAAEVPVKYHNHWGTSKPESRDSETSLYLTLSKALQWRHNGRDGVSNHPPHGCLLKRLFWRRSKKISKLRVTGLCEGNSLVIGEFPAQRASNAEKCFHLMTPSWIKFICFSKYCLRGTWLRIYCG